MIDKYVEQFTALKDILCDIVLWLEKTSYSSKTCRQKKVLTLRLTPAAAHGVLVMTQLLKKNDRRSLAVHCYIRRGPNTGVHGLSSIKYLLDNIPLICLNKNTGTVL